MEAIERGWGLGIVLWLQSLPFLQKLLLPFHYLGSEAFYLVLLPAIYWCVSERFGRRLTPLFLLSAWTNAFLKEWWQRPRPFQASAAVHPVVEGTGFGIPSGHAQNAAVVAGVVSLEARNRFLATALGAYALLMGLSRLVHGVHFPQDVVAGWTIGALFLAAYAWLEPKLAPWLARVGIVQQVALVVLVTGVSVVLLPGWVRPADPKDLALPYAALGTFAGASLGFALESRYVRFVARGGLPAVRLLLGFLVLIPMYVGLRMIPPLPRYTLVGLWVGFGAPWLFVRTGLASSSRSDAKDVL